MDLLTDYKDRNIVFFDGVCNFCNSTVDKVYSRNKARDLYYSSLQSDFAHRFLGAHGINSTDLDTVIFYSKGNFYFRSSAILQMSKHMTGIYRLLPGFFIIPGFIRDGFYKWFAKNRYKFFGKKETCRIPSPEEKKYFLE